MSVLTQTMATATCYGVEQASATEMKTAAELNCGRACHSRSWIMVLTALCLSACATHRSDPPQCKGPFTPINQSTSVVPNGP